MRNDLDGVGTTGIPEMFCWTKYGTEAGEGTASILARKERERCASGGVFLWGIGNAIGPSIELLLQRTVRPQIIFTPMLSKAATRDITPPSVAVWQSGVGLDGSYYEIPPSARVTSRMSAAGRAHYALVCRSTEPITGGLATNEHFASTHVQNLRSGSRVGASQVTSVVRRIACALGLLPSSYRVTFKAELVEPYLVRLCEYTLDDEPSPDASRQTPSPKTGSWANSDRTIFA